ncbi:MAG: 5'-methylthioadenosine/S-adenosylhomocysteine nucleosidase [Mycoplasmataceae bacterium]|jgi:adenosylhomocysteine nucleosidase|nr:5'-methylthioadenosine/S-adenosylhomocysteine nucleosidase [Mycoplasmataceae bacterium]
MIGFVIALESETPNLLSSLNDVHTSKVNNFDIHIANFLNEYVCLVYSGVGKVNAANATLTLINHFKVNKIINIGSCGAIASNIGLCDIILPNVISYYDVDVTAFGYEKNQLPKEPATYVIDKVFAEEVENVLKLYPSAINHGKVVTGETFINRKNIANFAIDEKAIGVDMEGAAIAQTCHHNNVKFVAIKVVSDSIFHTTSNEDAWKDNMKLFGNVINKIFADVAYTLIYNQQSR